jgi:hypothetical protein
MSSMHPPKLLRIPFSLLLYPPFPLLIPTPAFITPANLGPVRHNGSIIQFPFVCSIHFAQKTLFTGSALFAGFNADDLFELPFAFW